MSTDDQIFDTQDTARLVAKARRQGDEHLAQHLTRKWRESLPPYGTDERRWLETTFNNAYREANPVKPELFR